MTLRNLLVIGSILGLALASPMGCSKDGSRKDEDVGASASEEDFPDDPSAQVSDDQGGSVSKVVQGNNEFAADFYSHLKDKTSGNLFFSPYSLSAALAMTYAGAAGETQKQMAEVLHFTVPEQELHEGMARLHSILLAGKTKGYELRVANRLWGQEGYQFLPEFLQATRKYYGADLGVLDFAQNAEAARQEINDWVARQTEDKIEDFLAHGVLNGLTRLVLTNAVYFNGNWQERFITYATKDTPFHLSADKEVTVPMMCQGKHFRYRATDDCQVLQMPYAKNHVSMIVLLPKEIGGLTQLEKKLTHENLGEWAKGLSKELVIVYIPRFRMTSQFNLKATLQSMKMTLAFDQKADFSRISPREGLYISAVIHRAFVDVSEEGTEAAAATGISSPKSKPPLQSEKPPVFRADHPFLFLIRDNRTGSVLFMGRVVNPKE